MPATRRPSVLSATLAALVMSGVIATATPARADTRLLVGMGDSYSTGAGIPPEEPAAGDCQRSTAAYPLVAAAELGFTGHNVACGGAVLADFTATSRRGAPPQIEGVAGADLIAFTIGGNDVGGPGGVLDASRTTASMTSFAATVEALIPQLLASYIEVAQAAPGARIYALGYPDIVPRTQDELQTCLGPRAAGLSAAGIHHNVELLNAAIADAAASAGAVFVDITTGFTGHEMCSAQPYANAPDEHVPASPGAAMHPNQLGHLAMAAALLAAVGGPDPLPPPARPGRSEPPTTPPPPMPGLTAQERAAARASAQALLDRLLTALDRNAGVGR